MYCFSLMSGYRIGHLAAQDEARVVATVVQLHPEVLWDVGTRGHLGQVGLGLRLMRLGLGMVQVWGWHKRGYGWNRRAGSDKPCCRWYLVVPGRVVQQAACAGVVPHLHTTVSSCPVAPHST